MATEIPSVLTRIPMTPSPSEERPQWGFRDLSNVWPLDTNMRPWRQPSACREGKKLEQDSRKRGSNSQPFIKEEGSLFCRRGSLQVWDPAYSHAWLMNYGLLQNWVFFFLFLIASYMRDSVAETKDSQPGTLGTGSLLQRSFFLRQVTFLVYFRWGQGPNTSGLEEKVGQAG